MPTTHRGWTAVSICTVLTSLFIAACGGSPTRPTSPTSTNNYVGTWTGFTRLEECSLGSRFACATAFLPAPAITIALEAGSGGTVRGTVSADNYRFTVTGGPQSDGSLNLSGDGTNVGAALALTGWSTRDTNGVMSGRFSFRSAPNINNPSGDAAYSLDRVVKSGAAAPSFTGERLVLQAGAISAPRFSPSSPSPRTYIACGVMINYGPVSVTIPTVTVTPIGPSGSDFPVTQVVSQGAAPTVIRRGGAPSGCGFGAATDSDVTHPTATSYRLRIDYVYDDGVSGTLESVAAVTP